MATEITFGSDRFGPPRNVNLWRRIENFGDRKILGATVKDLVIGMGIGFAVKTGARVLLAGSGGIWAAVGAGTVAGAAKAGIREYTKNDTVVVNRGEIKRARKRMKELAKTDLLTRKDLKEEIRGIRSENRAVIAKAALKGAAIGAVSALVGAVVADVVVDFVQDGVLDIANLPFVEEFRHGIQNIRGFGEIVSGHGEAVAVVSHHEVFGHGEKIVLENSAVHVHSHSVLQPHDAEAFSPQVEDVSGEVVEPSVVVELEVGSSPWEVTREYLTEELGRAPSPSEMQNAVDIVLENNGITDPTLVPVGTEIDLTGVRVFLENAQVVDNVSEVSLLPGSTVWGEVGRALTNVYGRPATGIEIIRFLPQVMRDSGLFGVDPTTLAPGTLLNLESIYVLELAEDLP